MGKNKVPYIATHDGRTIRYPDPDIKARALGCLCGRATARARCQACWHVRRLLWRARAQQPRPACNEAGRGRLPPRWQPGAPDRLGEEHARRCEGAHREAEEASAKSAQAGAPAGGAARADARGRGAQVNDTVMFDIETGKIKDFIKFDVGQLVMVTGGRNQGRVGTIFSKEKHKGSFDICHVKDAQGHDFATRCARAAGHRV